VEPTAEQAEYLAGHQWATLATGRKDGSPQVSMIGYAWDGTDVLVTFRRTSAKYHNIARQPRVALLAADGRRALTLYGEAELLETGPARAEGFAAILAGFGAPAKPLEELVTQLDAEQRVVIRIHPTKVELQN
jgi:PPOX class probable F420-dependent enzyme